MEKTLTEKTEIWKAMPRNNAAELEIADRYFDEELMPMSLKSFVAKHSGKIRTEYDGMVLTLGTSWQPLALSISLLKPKKILFLCTPETMSQLDILTKFLNMPQESYEYKHIGRSDSVLIYDTMLSWVRRFPEKSNLCADITGGTKAMASAAAMMAAVLGMDIFYVESRYLPLYRRPEPGSEYLKQLENPQNFIRRSTGAVK